MKIEACGGRGNCFGIASRVRRVYYPISVIFVCDVINSVADYNLSLTGVVVVVIVVVVVVIFTMG